LAVARRKGSLLRLRWSLAIKARFVR